MLYLITFILLQTTQIVYLIILVQFHQKNVFSSFESYSPFPKSIEE